MFKYVRLLVAELEEAQRATEASAAQNAVSPTSAGAVGTTGAPAGLLSPPGAGAGTAPATPSSTPDYAIGLTSLNPATPAPATPAYGGTFNATMDIHTLCQSFIVICVSHRDGTQTTWFVKGDRGWVSSLNLVKP